MSSWAGLLTAACVAAAIAAWWYGRREERVPGRVRAAVLRGTALFLALSAPWVPELRQSGPSGERTAILLDVSLSMTLPAAPDAAETRSERALDALAGSEAREGATLWAFGSSVRRVGRDTLPKVSFFDVGSRLVPAIERARASGADSILVITDGEIEDREHARRLASRLGLRLVERRAAEPAGRFAIRNVVHPRSVTNADTVTLRVEVVAAGGAEGQVDVVASLTDSTTAAVQVEAPAAGRVSAASLRLAVALAGDTAEWQAVDVRLPGVPEPWRAAAGRRVWLRVTPRPTGAVLVSTDPDWEARYLMPVLERAVPGGARGFLRVSEGRFVTTGPYPETSVTESAVRRTVQGAALLVVQGRPADLPSWLLAAAVARPSLIFLVRGEGAIPGTAIRALAPLPGEWYASTAIPAGPMAGYVSGADAEDLPPFGRLYGSTRASTGAVLEAQRERRGTPRPVVVRGETASGRWAVVLGEGAWRWAARTGPGLNLYRGLYAGLVGWLLSPAGDEPVLLREAPRHGEAPVWRVAAGVRDLVIEVRDSTGRVVWADSAAAPADSLRGPMLEAGGAAFVARGRSERGPFQVAAPFDVTPAAELTPRAIGAPFDVRSVDTTERRIVGLRGRPPVWPFAAAVVLLCAEWLWRRRIGLR